MTRGKRSFGNAVKWAFVMNSGRRLSATVFTFLLAALLGPHDFGIVAMALVYIAVARMLNEQGFSTAIIQREDLDPEHLDSAFWLNLVWCTVLAGLLALSSGWWADVNNTPELAPVVLVLSSVLIFEGLSIVPQAVMERQLEYRKLAVRMNVAILVGGLVAVPLALAGAGVWALVAQQLVGDTILCVMLWAMGTWRPQFRFSRRHARDLIGFSSNVFAANVAGFVTRRGDALLLGLFFGPTAVGLYRLADRVVDVVLDVTMRPVAMVSLPVLSRLQADPEKLRAAVATCLRTTLLFTVPVMAVIFATSHELMAVLGPEWVPGAEALMLLTLVGVGKGIAFFTGPVLFASGRARFRAVMLWILAVVSTALVVGVGAALTESSIEDQITGMAASRAILFVPILVPINLWIIGHVTGLRLRSLGSSVPAPILAGLAAIGAARLLELTGLPARLPPLAEFAVVGFVSSLAAVAVLAALEPRVREQVRELNRAARSWGRDRWGPAPPAAPDL
jgi:PST family polysaccharide transporter